MRYSEKLRKLADWMDRHPDFPDPYNTPMAAIWVDTSEEFGRVCRTMGEFKKAGYSGTIEASYTELEHPNEKYSDRIFRVEVNHSGSCTQVPVLNDDGTPKTRKIRKPVAFEEVEEEVTDWVCPQSFLNL